MGKKQKRRHRLLVSYRIGQRWRAMPLLSAVMAAVLYGLAWLHAYGLMQSGNAVLLDRVWQERSLVLALIGFCLLIYLLIMVIARGSYVEVRPLALRVKAGLLPLDISYARVRSVKLGQVGAHFPAETLSSRDYALLAPLLHLPCTVVELKSWPQEPVRRLWPKFMFTPDGSGLVFVVEDAMLLNRQIDAVQTARYAKVRRHGQYKDPIERAVEAQRRGR